MAEETIDMPGEAAKTLHALSLGNLGLIYRARGDYLLATHNLAEAEELLTSLGLAAESQQVKNYREIVRLEGTSQAKPK